MKMKKRGIVYIVKMGVNKMKMSVNGKRGAAFIDFVIWIGMALGIAFLIFLIYLVLTGKLAGIVEAIKNILRFWFRF